MSDLWELTPKQQTYWVLSTSSRKKDLLDVTTQKHLPYTINHAPKTPAAHNSTYFFATKKKKKKKKKQQPTFFTHAVHYFRWKHRLPTIYTRARAQKPLPWRKSNFPRDSRTIGPTRKFCRVPGDDFLTGFHGWSGPGYATGLFFYFSPRSRRRRQMAASDVSKTTRCEVCRLFTDRECSSSRRKRE